MAGVYRPAEQEDPEFVIITRAAMRLFHDRGYAAMLPLRSVGVAVSKLSDEHAPAQMDLLGDTQARDHHIIHPEQYYAG